MFACWFRCSKELELKEDVRKLFEGMGACSSSCGEGGDDDIGRLLGGTVVFLTPDLVFFDPSLFF